MPCLIMPTGSRELIEWMAARQEREAFASRTAHHVRWQERSLRVSSASPMAAT